jgi:hypothetical protein
MSTGENKRRQVYRVKFYITSHDQGEKPSYVSEEEWDESNLYGEYIERDILSENFMQALEIAKHTMNEARMGEGLEYEIVSCTSISIPENA